jgi:dTDP-4-dehydrorhamnose reductase
MLWLIGNKGMLGTEFSLVLEKQGVPFTGTDREVDIADPSALASFAEARSRLESIDWIVNCAAYTAVDKAEDELDFCRRLNTEGPGNIARLARNIGARLIHISTDYVFDGRGIQEAGSLRPYRETDKTAPIGVYGLTKRDGERAVMENNPRSYVVRTAWLYGRYGGNFVSTMLRLMNERDEVKVVNDQYGSPTWARDLAETLAAIVTAEMEGRHVPYGVYHYTNEGNITWFDFAQEIYGQGRQFGLVKSDCCVRSCTSAEFPAKVTRPEYSVLDKTRIRTALGIDVPSWDESLIRYLRTSAKEAGLLNDELRSDVRWKQRFENYSKSLRQLTGVVNRYRSGFFTELERTACIKYYEMTFELAWKVMKDYLAESGIKDVLGSKDAIRQSFNNGIIDNGEIWMRMIESRNELVHFYDENTADVICAKIVSHYHDVLRCFAARMEKIP